VQSDSSLPPFQVNLQSQVQTACSKMGLMSCPLKSANYQSKLRNIPKRKYIKICGSTTKIMMYMA